MEKKLILLISILLFINLAFASDIENSIHMTIQTTYDNNSIQTGTFNFTFNISTASDCSNVVYSNSTNLTSNSRGIISYYLDNISLNFTDQYWLCYYRNGNLKNISKMSYAPYSFFARNVSWFGIFNLPNLLYSLLASNNNNNLLVSNGTAIGYNETILNQSITNVGINMGFNSTYNATYDSYLLANRSNSTVYWNGMNQINSTQIENNGGVLNILETWLSSFGWITNNVNNLINYYTKGEVYNKTEDINFDGYNINGSGNIITTGNITTDRVIFPISNVAIVNGTDGWIWLRNLANTVDRSLKVYNLYATNLIELAPNGKLLLGYFPYTDKWIAYKSNDQLVEFMVNNTNKGWKFINGTSVNITNANIDISNNITLNSGQINLDNNATIGRSDVETKIFISETGNIVTRFGN
jgi:hypothetical protein